MPSQLTKMLAIFSAVIKLALLEKVNIVLKHFSPHSFVQNRSFPWLLKYELDFYDYVYLLNHNIQLEFSEVFAHNENSEITGSISLEGFLHGVPFVAKFKENKLLVKLPGQFSYVHFSAVRGYLNGLENTKKIRISLLMLGLKNPSSAHFSTVSLKFFNACNGKLVATHATQLAFYPEVQRVHFLAQSPCAFVNDGRFSAPVSLMSNQKLAQAFKVKVVPQQPLIEARPEILTFEAGEIQLKKFVLVPKENDLQATTNSLISVNFELLWPTDKAAVFNSLSLELLNLRNKTQTEKFRHEPRRCFPRTRVFPPLSHFIPGKAVFPVFVETNLPFATDLPLQIYQFEAIKRQRIRFLPKSFFLPSGKTKFVFSVEIKDFKYVEFQIDNKFHLMEMNTLENLDMKFLYESQIEAFLEGALLSTGKKAEESPQDWRFILSAGRNEEEERGFVNKKTVEAGGLSFHFFVAKRPQRLGLISLLVDGQTIFSKKTANLDNFDSQLLVSMAKLKATPQRFFMTSALRKMRVSKTVEIKANENHMACFVFFKKFLLGNLKGSRKIAWIYSKFCRPVNFQANFYSHRISANSTENDILVLKSTAIFNGNSFTSSFNFSSVFPLNLYRGIVFLKTHKPEILLLKVAFKIEPDKKSERPSKTKAFFFRTCLRQEELQAHLADSGPATALPRAILLDSQNTRLQIFKAERRYFLRPFNSVEKRASFPSLKEFKCEKSQKKNYAIFYKGSKNEVINFFEDKIASKGISKENIFSLIALVSTKKLKPKLILRKITAKSAGFKLEMNLLQMDLLFHFSLSFVLLLKNIKGECLRKIVFSKNSESEAYTEKIFVFSEQNFKRRSGFWQNKSERSILIERHQDKTLGFFSTKLTGLKQNRYYKIVGLFCAKLRDLKFEKCLRVKNLTREFLAHNSLKNIVFSGEELLMIFSLWLNFFALLSIK